jgi:hypothetical protein
VQPAMLRMQSCGQTCSYCFLSASMSHPRAGIILHNKNDLLAGVLFGRLDVTQVTATDQLDQSLNC